MSDSTENRKKSSFHYYLKFQGMIYLVPFVLFIALNPSLILSHPVICTVTLALTTLLSLILNALIRRKLSQFMESIESVGEQKNSGSVLGSTIPGEWYGPLNRLQQIIGRDRDALSRFSRSVIETSRGFRESSLRLSAESEEQTGRVRQVLNSLEDSEKVSRDISRSIEEIYRITVSLKEAFFDGFDLIRSSLAKMKEIEASNKETLEGILYLSERIEKIWEIVNIINQITDQTKIIAFNAELEAAAAGDAGKNFQIVASEIRRLADSTMASTSEIRGKIMEIQQSSDNLIISSETGTEQIREGNNLSKELEKIFEEVLHSTEIATSSTEEIRYIIDGQVSSSEEFLATMRQIFQGMELLSRLIAGMDDYRQALQSASAAIMNQTNMNDSNTGA